MFASTEKVPVLVIFVMILCHTNAEENKTALAESVPDTVKATTRPPAELNAENCMTKRIGCCEQIYLGDEDVMVKCFTLHQSKLPKDYGKDPAKLFKFFSCFVECQYKIKKYLAKGENINMKMVKKDAEKTYVDRPKERDYHIALFEFCRKDAANLYNLVKMNPGGRVLLKDNCKPYYMFVFLCAAVYHNKIPARCPYFKWEGKSKTEAQQDCELSKAKCYEIDGIHL